MSDADIVFIILAIVLAIFLFLQVLAVVDMFGRKKKHDAFLKEDDPHPIPNVTLMQNYCTSVHSDALFQTLNCWVCPYHEECEEYIIRYGKQPNGTVLYNWDDEQHS